MTEEHEPFLDDCGDSPTLWCFFCGTTESKVQSEDAICGCCHRHIRWRHADGVEDRSWLCVECQAEVHIEEDKCGVCGTLRPRHGLVYAVLTTRCECDTDTSSDDQSHWADISRAMHSKNKTPALGHLLWMVKGVGEQDILWGLMNFAEELRREGEVYKEQIVLRLLLMREKEPEQWADALGAAMAIQRSCELGSATAKALLNSTGDTICGGVLHQ